MSNDVDIDELVNLIKLNPWARVSDIAKQLEGEARIRREKQNGISSSSSCEACAQTNGCLCNSRDEDDRWYWSR